MARPNVLLFQDFTWNPTKSLAQKAKYEAFHRKIGTSPNILVMELGAGVGVRAIRRFGEGLMQQNPKTAMVRLNLDHAYENCIPRNE